MMQLLVGDTLGAVVSTVCDGDSDGVLDGCDRLTLGLTERDGPMEGTGDDVGSMTDGISDTDGLLDGEKLGT